ncbi:unnamed protein product [Rotaria socialis]|uniref:Glycosyltransferase 61 catalytic domain-containing protein n=1 Tax=Rotaria socialis TaxID=392032 RepID=A0A818AC79_9BILA|nr:unnamed protein product [Rotaria socialis]CAF3385696.1 unnamed protein product [Rotaria socialis]CAF3404133.1 unnamed protein product [Rotaria socialis]CAF3733445.1 unnamed protein product [Rotaria socialis]CAF4440694.1 unnamed protein product [Rotaria socialis]
MTHIISEQESSSKAQHGSKKSLRLALLCATIGIIAISFVLKSSLKSKLILFSEHQYKKAVSTASCKQDNVFNHEVAITYFPQNIHQRISKFRCTGSENDIRAWEDRLCVFYNTCYNRDSGHFYYFRPSGSKAKPIFYDSAKGMLFEFSLNNSRTEFVSLAPDGHTPWGPIISNETYPSADFTILHQLHSLIKSRHAQNSIAHGLWEDLGSISYSMERMNIFDQKLVIMHLGKIPNTKLFSTYRQYVIPALTENAMVEFEIYVTSFKTKHVCFDRLIVGGQLSVFPKLKIKENHGREALFYNWRSKIIKYSGFDPNFLPRKHHIIVTNKSHSLFTNSHSNRHRAIVNLKEVEMFIKLTYPTISSEVIEWHTIPFKKQIEKLLQTTILITPCGGVSLIIPMLPHGAHAIVMDYYVSVAAHGFHAGESGSMEGAFLNHISHVRKQYYQVYGRSDYEFDYPGTSDTREQASTIVNMTRLQLLIDKALEEMEP